MNQFIAIRLAAGWVFVFAAVCGVAQADTMFLGGNLNDSANWTHGLPASGNPGIIAVDGTNETTVFGFGADSIVDHSAGTITASDGFNITSGTWNISG